MEMRVVSDVALLSRCRCIRSNRRFFRTVALVVRQSIGIFSVGVRLILTLYSDNYLTECCVKVFIHTLYNECLETILLTSIVAVKFIF